MVQVTMTPFCFPKVGGLHDTKTALKLRTCTVKSSGEPVGTVQQKQITTETLLLYSNKPEK